jgi:galactose mutarotase-like enzyme
VRRIGSDELRVAVDPARGGAIRSAVATRASTELLYRPHWRAGKLDAATTHERAWTRAWRGGWNLLVPNAGAACEVEGRRHPFHGNGSTDPWRVVARDACSLVLRWWDAGGTLEVERRIDVDGPRLRATTRLENRGDTPARAIVVEHLILGAAVLGRRTNVQIGGAMLVPLADEGPPLPVRPRPWPEAARHDEVEDWSRRPVRATSRFGALRDVDERQVVVDAPERRLTARLTWSETFPFLWFWEERENEAAPPWNRRTTCLGLEPATASSGEGLAVATARGEAVTLDPGAERGFWAELEVST